jgi:hypothetical protein
MLWLGWDARSAQSLRLKLDAVWEELVKADVVVPLDDLAGREVEAMRHELGRAVHCGACRSAQQKVQHLRGTVSAGVFWGILKTARLCFDALSSLLFGRQSKITIAPGLCRC